MTCRRLVTAALAGLLLLSADKAALAYEADVHFQLTYVLARLTGYPDLQSLQIASANQSVDQNDSTIAIPNLGLIRKSYWVERGRRWHALDFSREEQLRQKDLLWRRACEVAQPRPPAQYKEALSDKPLVYLGQYFHYFQDHYAHRRLDLPDWPKHDGDWTPFDPVVGHYFEKSQPDRIPKDVAKAEQMAAATARDLTRFRRTVLHLPAFDVHGGKIKDLIETLRKTYNGGQPKEPFPASDRKQAREKLNELVRGWEPAGTTPIVVPKWEERIRYKFRLDGTTTNLSDVEKQTKEARSRSR